jgi:hypothetical protein
MQHHRVKRCGWGMVLTGGAVFILSLVCLANLPPIPKGGFDYVRVAAGIGLAAAAATFLGVGVVIWSSVLEDRAFSRMHIRHA